MHRTIEGVYRIGGFCSQWLVGKAVRAYLEPIRDSMQKPIGGRFVWAFSIIRKSYAFLQRSNKRYVLRYGKE
jgi:predicted transcriptional regulator